MGLIKDTDYKLPIIYPEAIRDNFENSANKPILIFGRDTATGEENRFVLKPVGAGRMHPDAIVFELVASFMAIEMGYNTPKPCLVEVDNECIEMFEGNVSEDAIKKSAGLNFGTVFHEGYSVWKPDNFNFYKNNFRKIIESIFVFDMLIENVDRKNDRPNMISNGLDIMILDHEIAFSFAMAVIYNNPTPWKIRQEDLFFFQQHIFFNYFKKRKLCCDDYLPIFSTIDVHFWNKIENIIPDNYLQGKYNIIKEFMSLRISKIDLFLKDLEGVMS